MDTTQQLRGLKETIDKAVEAKRTVRNEADRRFIVANIGQDLVAILTPLMQQIAFSSRINRDELKSIIQTIRFEAPQVTVGSPEVTVKAPEVNVTNTPAEFPKEELISAIQKAILKVKFPKTEVKVDAPKIPDKVKVEQMKELINSVKKFADVQYSLDTTAIYKGVNNDTAKPLPVILTDEKGKFYKALMTAISAGGGGSGGLLGKDVDALLHNTGASDVIGDGRKVVTTAGTRVRLVSEATNCKEIDIMAEVDNGGYIVVGGVTVIADQATRRGIPLTGGQSIRMAISDLYSVYIDSTVNGEGVTFTYYN